jgi:broad specificity phosphatase PhoE
VEAETSIYLIRHAHAHWREDEARPLSSPGVEAAQLVAARLVSRPIAAVYTSPSRRSIETVQPLADRLGLHPELVEDLRERELPVVAANQFDTLIRQAWDSPGEAPGGGESNVRAQGRALAVVRAVTARHAGSQAVVATHGNLLALVLNALDPSFGYEFWRRLSFPDIYQLAFHGLELRAVERLWHAAGPAPVADAGRGR